MMPAKKFTAFLLGLLAAFFAVSTFALDEKPSTRELQQSALVFNRSNMEEVLASSAIRAPGLPLIYSSRIRLACMSVPVWKGDIMAYLPETSTCVSFSVLSNSSQRSFTIQTGHDGRTISSQKMLQNLQTKPYLVSRITAPAESFSMLQSAESVAGACSCPGNVAPIVNLVSGGGQQVNSNSPVGNIVFSGTDLDSDVLFDFFSYQLDGGAPIDGLPAGLSKSCTTGTGTIDCTVSGNAPGTAGAYSIILDVSDGFDTTSESTGLTVNAINPPLPETIFENGFEDTP